MSRRDDSCAGRGQPTAVVIVERPEGDHVVVAMEHEGVLHRHPEGAWERRGVLDRDPVSTFGPSWLQWLMLIPLLVMVVAPLVLFVARRGDDHYRRQQGFLCAVCGAIALLAAGGGLAMFGLDYVVAGPLIAGASVVLFGVSLWVAWRPPRRTPPWPTW